MSKSDDSAIPKSMRHKRILDLAAENPDASIRELAAEVPSATADLVEHVLEQYGDPAGPTVGEPTDGDDDTDTGGVGADDADATDGAAGGIDGGAGDGDADVRDDDDDAPAERECPSVDDLTEKQLEVVRAIARRPKATQRELGEEIGVTAATVSNRANDIEGFEWGDRAAFVRAVLDDVEPDRDDQELEAESPNEENEHGTTEKIDETMATKEAEPETAIDRLEERVIAIEERLADDPEPADAVFTDPELAHKVVHACMRSDAITEEEELRILEAILQR